MFLKKRKQKGQKKFVATAVGHAPWGLGVAECFYNLYEYEDGMREYEEFDGGQYHEIPNKVDIRYHIKKHNKVNSLSVIILYEST